MKAKKAPNQLILNMLQGPPVPKDFECDGCTMSPDAWFYWACRIHDYEAHKLRKHWGDMVFCGVKNKEIYEGYYKNYVQARENLRSNIRILSTFYVDKRGNLKVRKFWNPKRLIGWQAGKLYGAVTGSIFKWATTGKGKT